jgi:hypothetical protein
MIAASPALLAKEKQILVGYTSSLAELLRAETGARPNDVSPWVVANTLIGLHATLIDYVRRRLLEGQVDIPRLARDVRRQARDAVELLREGLGDYGLHGS